MPQMIEGWQEKIDASQNITHLHANGVAYARESYDVDGYEDYPHCGDCAVATGQLHVCHPHGSCDWEQCPKCMGQLLGCDCQFDEFEDEE